MIDVHESVAETAESLTTARFRSPKTILGFFAASLGILATATVVLVAILAKTAELHSLLVPVLCVSGGVFLLLVGGVFVTMLVDPTLLMLGEVSGDVFVRLRQMKLGDSTRGEYTVKVPEPRITTKAAGLLPPKAPESDK